MRTMLLGAAVLLAVIPGPVPQRSAARTFDPVGTWTYNTQDQSNKPVTGTLQITGTPGAYQATLRAGDDTLTVSDILTSGSGMVVLAELPDKGGTAVIKTWRAADGTYQGGWAPVQEFVPATVTHTK